MEIIPDLFEPFKGRIEEGLLGLKYPDCPINSVCAYVSTTDHLPTAKYRCLLFEEPEKRNPICMYKEVKDV